MNNYNVPKFLFCFVGLYQQLTKQSTVKQCRAPKNISNNHGLSSLPLDLYLDLYLDLGRPRLFPRGHAQGQTPPPQRRVLPLH